MPRRRSILKFLPVFVIFVLVFKFIYVDNGFNLLMNICLPIFLGLFIAIALNPVLIFVEEKLKIKSRGLAIVITYLLFIAFIALIVVMVMPGVLKSISDFIHDVPDLIKSLNNYIIELSSYLREMGADNQLFLNLELTILDYTRKISSLMTSLVNTALISAFGVLSAVWNFFISIFISIYLMYDKEHFENLFVKTCYGLFEDKYADELVKLGYNLYSNVTNFIAGKILDSFIIGVLAFLGAKYLIKAPYSLIIAVIIGVTNMIPYFGPFIGGVPACLLTLLFDPMKGLWMGLFVLVLQQFDGWFLGPKILGIKLALRPIWIIIAIIIGGGLFGPVGMFLATPFAALIKTIVDGYMTIRLQDRDLDLPHENK